VDDDNDFQFKNTAASTNANTDSLMQTMDGTVMTPVLGLTPADIQQIQQKRNSIDIAGDTQKIEALKATVALGSAGKLSQTIILASGGKFNFTTRDEDADPTQASVVIDHS